MNMNTTADISTSAYSISAWPDYGDLMGRLNELLKQPVRGIARQNMPKVLDYFETNCKTSKALAERAKEVIPGGVQHNLAFNYPFAIAAAKVEGAYMWDEDGNRYIDFLQAGARRFSARTISRSARRSMRSLTAAAR